MKFSFNTLMFEFIFFTSFHPGVIYTITITMLLDGLIVVRWKKTIQVTWNRNNNNNTKTMTKTSHESVCPCQKHFVQDWKENSSSIFLFFYLKSNELVLMWVFTASTKFQLSVFITKQNESSVFPKWKYCRDEVRKIAMNSINKDDANELRWIRITIKSTRIAHYLNHSGWFFFYFIENGFQFDVRLHWIK